MKIVCLEVYEGTLEFIEEITLSFQKKTLNSSLWNRVISFPAESQSFSLNLLSWNNSMNHDSIKCSFLIPSFISIDMYHILLSQTTGFDITLQGKFLCYFNGEFWNVKLRNRFCDQAISTVNMVASNLTTMYSWLYNMSSVVRHCFMYY
jgi:hypothetical protein